MNPPGTTHLQCAYLPLDQFKIREGHWKNTMLGAVAFGSLSDVSGTPHVGAPFIPVAMPSLGSAGASIPTGEVWCAEGKLSYGELHGVRYGHNDDIVFGAIQLNESDFNSASVREAGKTPLQQATETAYRSIFSLIDGLGFPHVMRFWNYMADITGHSHDLERYRQFNMGRQDGFLGSGRQVTGGVVPAASAVGFESGPLTVYFLAGRGTAPVAIENPRQVSAYDYPREYGPRSPTFSRATMARLGGSDVLFLSGTASIVGHRTLHAGDVVAQVRETLANIAAMVAEANRVAPTAGFTLGDLCYKVYVRHEKDVVAIHDELRRALGDTARLMFLKADICRPDLLMEIEATAGHPIDFAVPA
ncbi:MAG TPA: hypothetical protein VFF81_07235 [Noviherbaspirillum sp.]|nr:hypothetical protein [Noviherbaspirillum sp.]